MGHCDATSLRGEGPLLSGMINPTSTPKPQAEVERVLAQLARPSRLRIDNKDMDTPAHMEATIAAAAAGNLSPARLGAAIAPSHGSPVAGTSHAGPNAAPAVILPPPEILRTLRSPRSRRPDREEPDDVDESARERLGLIADDLGIPKATHRKSRKMK